MKISPKFLVFSIAIFFASCVQEPVTSHEGAKDSEPPEIITALRESHGELSPSNEQLTAEQFQKKIDTLEDEIALLVKQNKESGFTPYTCAHSFIDPMNSLEAQGKAVEGMPKDSIEVKNFETDLKAYEEERREYKKLADPYEKRLSRIARAQTELVVLRFRQKEAFPKPNKTLNPTSDP